MSSSRELDFARLGQLLVEERRIRQEAEERAEQERRRAEDERRNRIEEEKKARPQYSKNTCVPACTSLKTTSYRQEAAPFVCTSPQYPKLGLKPDGGWSDGIFLDRKLFSRGHERTNICDAVACRGLVVLAWCSSVL